MIGRLLDKLFFGAALVLALQVPLLADHYRQFLSGLYESTKWQVDGYKATAKQYGYAGVGAMIEHHLRNDVPSVRKDAAQKRVALDRYEELRVAVEIFDKGNLIEKMLYMLGPSRYRYLQRTIENFKPGLPLTIGGWTFGVVVGFAVSFVATLPFMLWSQRWRRKKTSGKAESTRISS